MSQETIEDLQLNTLIGYTDKRGTAWHYRADLQENGESNHYPGSIPIEDVRRRLFNWLAVEGTLTAVHTPVPSGDALEDLGGMIVTESDTFKAIMRGDTGAILGIFKQGYTIHQYDQWLVENIEALLNTELAIGSAGLLKGGAQAWVQIEMADTIDGPEGYNFRPFLTGATSLDGSLSTTYLTGAQVVVCDNTLSAALGHASESVKIKHSRNSLGRISDVRDALGIVNQVADQFAKRVQTLLDEPVSDAVWKRLIEQLTFVPEDASGRAETMALEKRRELTHLWNFDDRVTPWKNTALGVVQAINTWSTHIQSVRGTERGERNAAKTLAGDWSKLDTQSLELLAAAR